MPVVPVSARYFPKYMYKLVLDMRLDMVTKAHCIMARELLAIRYFIEYVYLMYIDYVVEHHHYISVLCRPPPSIQDAVVVRRDRRIGATITYQCLPGRTFQDGTIEAHARCGPSGWENLPTEVCESNYFYVCAVCNHYGYFVKSIYFTKWLPSQCVLFGH